jgi:N-acetylmuramoyl-L-alanine amidase
MSRRIYINLHVGVLALKRLIIILCLSLIVCFNFAEAEEKQSVEKLVLNNKTIVIDPGHGGYDPGAVWGELYEKDINLKICQELKNQFEQKGAKVVLTRTGDFNYALVGQRGLVAKRYDLNQRIIIANKNEADILLTVHVNSTRKSSYEGAETFYHHNSNKGRQLALAIQQQFSTIPGMTKRAAKISDCYMLRYSKMPAVLIEVGYLSNERERGLLQDDKYLNTLASKIAMGVIEFYASPGDKIDGTNKVTTFKHDCFQ